MEIVQQEIGKTLCWIDDLLVKPLSIVHGQASLGIWLSESVHDAERWLEQLLRIRCDGNRHWLYPPGGPRMLALQLKEGQRVWYDHLSQLSIQTVGVDRLTLRLDGDCCPLLNWLPRRTGSQSFHTNYNAGTELAIL